MLLSREIVVGRVESGRDLVISVAAASHLIVQGMSRSGKSVLVYDLLAPLAVDPSVAVVGIDPSGILLAPWKDHPFPAWRVLGTSSMEAAAKAVGEIVAEMDRRIMSLWDIGADKLESFDEALPLLMVVLEEFPGTLAQAKSEDAEQGRKPQERVATKIQAGVRRLIQEGAKVGVRVLIIAQRADAEIVGGAERSNLGTRISMHVDNRDAVSMLHPSASPELIEAVLHAPPGVGLIETPTIPLQLFKADLVEYSDYSAWVKRHG